jgi:hypothetical protein
MTGSVDWNSDNMIAIVESANKLSLLRYLLFWNTFLLPFAVVSSRVSMSVFLSCLVKETKVLRFLLFRHGVWFWGRAVSCRAQHTSLSVLYTERALRALSSGAHTFCVVNMLFTKCWYSVNSGCKIVKNTGILINSIYGIIKILL